ncbi:MAG: type II toxin-antitoxin system HipA family toxin [Hyphomicrobiaceae bacterium]|nr:type II toxin-antitoxin system HipA family toxin [Hyphomicrobiaceae bacterium]
MAELPIYYETRAVGAITASADGPSFLYDPAWLATRGAFPISLLMPLTRQRAPPSVFAPWAANLLPESTQLSAVGRMLGTSPEDAVAILSEIGRDTAGALSIGRPGSAETGGWKAIGPPRNLERIIEELPSKPFLVGEEGVSMSLAGVQSKLGVAIDARGRLCVPHDGAPSTYILKPDSDRLYGGVQNEALCLTLARRMGLAAVEITTGKAGRRSYLLVRRYDRLEQQGRWRRAHQEDFCQALGKPPFAKYEANQSGIKGPTLADMFAVARTAMQAPDILNLVDYVVFNVLACNTDAHAKNYSMMISARGFALAPMYDVMCAAAWDNVTRNMAQKIAGKSRGEHLKRRHWVRCARDCGLNPSGLVKRVEELGVRVLREVGPAAEAVAAMPAGSHALMPRFVEAIAARARAVLAGLSDLSGSDDEETEAAPPPPPPKRAASRRPKTPAPSARKAGRGKG